MLKIGTSIHGLFKTLLSGLKGVLARGMIILLVLNLAACGAGDIQFEGKIFEAVGLDGSLTGKRPDPKISERSPLVLPPAADLPEPGKRVAAQDTMNWPDDPDKKVIQEASLLEEQRKKYCRDIGRNEHDPYYDEKKAVHCGSLLSKALSQSFGRAPENDNQ